jgi:hypothetical protein
MSSNAMRWLDEDLKDDLAIAKADFLSLARQPVVTTAVGSLLKYLETKRRQKIVALVSANAATFPGLQAEIKAVESNMLDVQELLKEAEKKQ